MNLGDLTKSTTGLLHKATNIYSRVKKNIDNPFQVFESNLADDEIVNPNADFLAKNEESDVVDSKNLFSKVTTASLGKKTWGFLFAFALLFLFSLVYLSGPSLWNKAIFSAVAVFLTEAVLALS